MGFQCGIVGLPNVGKSTLFNALTATISAEAANYPFCTIEPNVGRIQMPDARLGEIAALAKSAKITQTQLDFVDIAGLVAGASKGEGLGNQFLAHIREVDAIAHVLRCFSDPNIAHVTGVLDPVSDAETVETELMLADLDSLERRTEPLVKRARGNDKEAKAMLDLVERATAHLEDGRPARSLEVAAGECALFRQMQLLTAKPVMYVCNVEEGAAAAGNALSARVAERAAAEGAACVVISAAIEAEVAQLADAGERAEFLTAIGLEEPGLARFIRVGYALLGLITFFTAGPTEARAWTIPGGTRAAQAAGTIHTDFERGFIAAETIVYDDFIACGGELGAKETGKMRQEGRDYVVRDGDVILFRFNV
jgi:hypothetical protein